MPKVEKKGGFIPIANEIIDRLAAVNLSPHETRVLMAIFRKTYGWRKNIDRISFSQFEKVCSLPRRQVIRALQRLEERRIILVVRPEERKANWYQLNEVAGWRVDNTGDSSMVPSVTEDTTPSVRTDTRGVVSAQPLTTGTLKDTITTHKEKIIPNRDSVLITLPANLQHQKEQLLIKMTAFSDITVCKISEETAAEERRTRT